MSSVFNSLRKIKQQKARTLIAVSHLIQKLFLKIYSGTIIRNVQKIHVVIFMEALFTIIKYFLNLSN